MWLAYRVHKGTRTPVTALKARPETLYDWFYSTIVTISVIKLGDGISHQE